MKNPHELWKYSTICENLENHIKSITIQEHHDHPWEYATTIENHETNAILFKSIKIMKDIGNIKQTITIIKIYWNLIKIN